MKIFPRSLSVGEEKKYLEHYEEGSQSTRDMLIEYNMRLTARMAKRYQGSDYGMKDLLSVGTIGLTKVMNAFSANKGSRLATYTAKRVENEMLMLLRVSRKYSKEVPLSEPIGVDKDGETVNLVDVIEMDSKEAPDTMVFGQDVKELYEAFESCLTKAEKTVLRVCYRLYRGKEHTQRETAGELGISRSYMNRTKKKVIEKI